MTSGITPGRSSHSRLRWLVAIVVAVSAVSMAAVVVLQHQSRDAHEKETQARIYSAGLKQSIDNLVPVGVALSQRAPEVLETLVQTATDRLVGQLRPIRSIDPTRTQELQTLVERIKRAGVVQSPADQVLALSQVMRASRIADQIAAAQAARASSAELRSLIGSGGALAFAVLAVFLLVSRERRRSVADAEAHMATVEHLAEHDALTELPNRRRFDADIERLASDGGTVEIAVCDLNEFKDINDRLGHDAGDAVLITIGRDLQASIGSAGTVYRTGGDEFRVVSAPGRRVADLARRALERDESTTVGSVGAATFPTDHALARDVVRLADRRMYAAKRAVESAARLAG